MRLLSFVLVAALAATAGWFAALRVGGVPPPRSIPVAASASEPSGTARKIKFYQSPMHPWIKSDKPGKCTICGMTLVPVYEGEAGIATGDGLVTLAPASAAVIGVQTSEVRRAPLTRTLRVAGVIDDDETRHRYLAAYTDARIEQLFVHTTGVEIAAGQPLAVVYSPDLLTARQEFHALARTPSLQLQSSPSTGRDAPSPLLAAAREKLRRLGLLDAQIDALATAETVTRDTEILAPLAGIVVARNEAAYAGGYIKAGDVLFTIGDFGKMWFVFDAYEADLPALKTGAAVTVTLPSLPGDPFIAPLAFIDPNLNASTRTAKARVVLDNADRRLLHRQTAYGRVAVETPETLLVPRSAVLFTQAEPVVYVDKTGGAYEPRTVKLGRAGDTAYEVLAGLQAGEKVVTEGALLIDSQAQLAHSAEGRDGPPGRPSFIGGPGGPSLPSTDTGKLPVPPQSLVFASADAAATLAADDLAAYAKFLPALIAAVHASGPAHEILMPSAANLVPGPDLKAARAAFEPFSTAVADLVRAQPAGNRGVKIFECPMSPVLGKARWLQRGEPLRNPFFGSEMLECGEEITTVQKETEVRSQKSE